MNESKPSDHYHTVAVEATAETKVKGSRFLAEIHRARTEEEARTILDRVRKLHHDATHHCSAWRVGVPENLRERFDDDGEPSGTAGRPILNALQGARLHEVIAVVTRWFGGTKLGTGGLARAYSEAVSLTLSAAGQATIYREVEIEVHADYERIGAVEAWLGRESARVRGVQRSYSSESTLRVRVLRGDADRMVAGLRECTGGRARFAVRELD